MKNRRILQIIGSILFVFCCLYNATGTAVHAGAKSEYYTDVYELAGIEFDSYENLMGFLADKYNDPQIALWDFADYLLTMDSLYVSSQHSDRISEFEICLFTPTYVCTSFVFDDIRYQFYYYYSDAAGKRAWDIAEADFEKARNCAGRVFRNGNWLYYYQLPYFYDVESYYVWQQENKYFILRVGTAIDEKNIALCDAEAVPLPSAGVPVDKAAETYDSAVFAAIAAAVSAVGWLYSGKKH